MRAKDTYRQTSSQTRHRRLQFRTFRMPLTLSPMQRRTEAEQLASVDLVATQHSLAALMTSSRVSLFRLAHADPELDVVGTMKADDAVRLCVYVRVLRVYVCVVHVYVVCVCYSMEVCLSVCLSVYVVCVCALTLSFSRLAEVRSVSAWRSCLLAALD